jgi:glycerol-3-phosphate acyltransferase PlsX
MAKVAIALDAMGGDMGIATTVPAALSYLRRHPEVTLLLVGDAERLAAALPKVLPKNLELVAASQVIAMDESPISALRNKRDSSMRVALELVKSGRAQGCVSAGNTGALVAVSRYVLKTFGDLDRPAICAPMPTRQQPVLMLDLGANVDCSPLLLQQFAIMGASLARQVYGRARPKVALLNIGSEDIKGNAQVKATAELLEQSPSTWFDYMGFAEGDSIFSGDYDVIVSDGFIGNIALKTIEGTAKLISYFLKKSINSSIFNKISALAASMMLRTLKQKMDPRQYNGANLLGLRNVVIKSHGSADAVSFQNAIETARVSIAQQVPTLVASHLELEKKSEERL